MPSSPPPPAAEPPAGRRRWAVRSLPLGLLAWFGLAFVVEAFLLGEPYPAI